MPGLGAPGAGAKPQMRPGGGFRQSFGDGMSDEHEDSGAAAAAAAQKQALTDQAEVQAPAEEKPAAAQEGKPAEAQATDATKAKPAAKEETEQPQKLEKS